MMSSGDWRVSSSDNSDGGEWKVGNDECSRGCQVLVMVVIVHGGNRKCKNKE